MMIRRLLPAAALVAAAVRLSYAAACGPIPAGSGPLLNGFEGSASACAGNEADDIADWGVTSDPAGATLTQETAPYTPEEGSDYGYATDSGDVEYIYLTLTTASSLELAANDDWADDNYLMVAYDCSPTTTANKYVLQFQLFNGTAATPASFQLASDLAGSSVWSYAVTSLNYVLNEGLADNDITWLKLVASATTPNTLGVSYDDLQLDPIAGTLDTPNNPLTPAQITESPDGCAAIDLSWTALSANGGTDAINGYQIYRSTTLESGPYSSIGYVLNSAAVGGVITFTDNVAGASATDWYIVLPYSSTSTAFGPAGTASYFTGCVDTTVDKYWAVGDGGVDEALLNTADAVGPYNPNVGCSPTDTPSQSPTFTQTPTLTQTLTATPTSTATPTASPTSTSTATPSWSPSATPSSTPSDTATPTFTPTYSSTPTPTLSFTASDTPTYTLTSTPSPTVSATSTSSPTFSSTATPTFTPTPTLSFTVSDTPTWTLTSTSSPTASATSTPTPTLSPSATPTQTQSPTDTPTPSPSFTISPTWTPTEVTLGQYWPNPFYPDRGTHEFHLGDQPPGLRWQVFNMIGQLVWQATTTGNPSLDYWNGQNGQGVEVTTGIYLLYINGRIVRFAVVRN